MRTMRRIVCITLIALFAGVAVPARAQEKPRRLRIGLALAGGSARGLAHVGVLKWLEEHRIPVDYVAGTSMGGLVGGLYASGASVQEIEKFLRELDWNEVFQGSAAYRASSFRRKEDMRELPSRVEFGLRGGFQVPTALNPGHGVELALGRFAARYGGLRSFDELPTPFRCVAADLVDGKEVVFQDGDLVTALRATMSIPVVFAPTRLGDRVLVDGGTLNNLPVDVVKQMGADIVIAVALPSPSEEPAASLVSVADRALTIMVQSNERRNMQLADLVLMPDLKGLGSADFDRYEEFAARGFGEAARKERFLATLAVGEPEWQAYLAERQRRRVPAAFTPRFVEVEGVSGERKERIENRFASFLGVSVDTARMEEELTRVTGLGRYESASYSAARRGTDDGLRITVREKSYGPPILKFLLNLEGSDLDEVRFDVAARLTFVDFGGPYSEWRTDVNLGNPNRISSEYYWRIRGSRAFLAPRSFLTYSQRGFYAGNERVAETSRQEAGAGLDFGFTPDRRSELRFGYEMNRTSEFISTGMPLLPKVEGIFHLVRAAWTFDELDNPVVPRSGVRSSSTIRWLFDGPQVRKGLPILESELTAAVTFSPRYSLLARMSGGTTAGRAAPIAPFRLGGPLRLSPLVVDQLRGQNYYFGSFSLLRAFSDRRLHFLGKTYFSMSYEIGDAFDDLDHSDPFHGGTLGILAETPFGGLFIGGSIGEQGQRKMFFRIGRLF